MLKVRIWLDDLLFKLNLKIILTCIVLLALGFLGGFLLGKHSQSTPHIIVTSHASISKFPTQSFTPSAQQLTANKVFLAWQEKNPTLLQQTLGSVLTKQLEKINPTGAINKSCFGKTNTTTACIYQLPSNKKITLNITTLGKVIALKLN